MSAARKRAGTSKGLLALTPDLSLSRPPKWAWQDRIVLGSLNLIIGAEGIGKGTLAAWQLARWTQGELDGDLHGQPVCVAVVGDEDSMNDVWTPRLHAAGADLARVRELQRPDGGYLDLADDIDALAAAVRKFSIRVLYLDALLDNLGVGVDDWRAKPVRAALQPARILARELDVAIIGSLHPNKSGNTFRNLVQGSAQFNAVSRSSLLVAEDPDNDGGRVLVRGKGNLSAQPPAIQFQIASHTFKANGHEFKVPLVTDVEDGGDITVDYLIAASQEVKTNTRVGGAEEVIKALLPRDGEWHPARPILDACADQGFGERLTKRAKEALGIEHHRAAEFKAPSQWRWPTTVATTGRHALAGPSSPSVPSATTTGKGTQDTQATRARGSTRGKRVRTKPAKPRADGDAT